MLCRKDPLDAAAAYSPASVSLFAVVMDYRFAGNRGPD
jgi:hypothetical protein